jgi:hypothetical protein
MPGDRQRANKHRESKILYLYAGKSLWIGGLPPGVRGSRQRIEAHGAIEGNIDKFIMRR